MSTIAPFRPHQKHHRPSPPPQPPPPLLRRPSSVFFRRFGYRPSSSRARFVLFIAASSAPSFDELHAKGRPRRGLRKNSVLLNLIHEIEPLDVSLIQKDVPPNTIAAMKRTISSMLGLLPSDQFHISIEAFWEPLSKLLISSIMTGYTLRNAEYRLCLERNLDIHEDILDGNKSERAAFENSELLFDSSVAFLSSERSNALPLGDVEKYDDSTDLQNLGEMTPEARDYINYLQTRLSSVKEINEEASDEVLEVEQKYNEMRRPVYEKRDEIIESIPDFWPTAFLSHPALGELLSEEDKKIFKYLDSLNVEDSTDVKSGFSITFNFAPNPYFENAKLTKVFSFSDEGMANISGTPIKWKEGMETSNGAGAEMKGKKRSLDEESFFTWFTDTQEKDSSEAINDEIADIIKEDLWPNPLKYFSNEADEYEFDGDEDDEEKGSDDDGDQDDEDDDN